MPAHQVKIQKIELVDIIEEDGPALQEEEEVTGPPKKKEEAKKLEKQFTPLFKTELLVRNDGSKKFFFSPSLTEYLSTIDSLLKIYLTTVENSPPLTNSSSPCNANTWRWRVSARYSVMSNGSKMPISTTTSTSAAS